MEHKEFYGQTAIPKEEIERMEKIEYPTYVSETILNSWDLKNKKVLDSGAGPNPKLAEFVQRKGGMYTPLDLRIDVLKEMHMKLKAKGVPFYGVVGDVHQLPFKDESFDVVHQRFVLMNIAKESRKKALEELLRVSKEKLVLLEYNWRALHSNKNPEAVSRFQQIAFKIFKTFSTDPYMGEQFEKLLKEFNPNLKFSIQHFERKEDASNTIEFILNLKVFYNIAKNILKDDAFAEEIKAFTEELEKSPAEFTPPEIVAVVIEK